MASTLNQMTIKEFPKTVSVKGIEEFLKRSDKKILIYGIGGVSAIYLGWRTFKTAMKAYNAYFFNDLATNCKEVYLEPKKKLFEGLKELTERAADSQKEKKITILEIGVGAGANFDYYPDGTHLIVVDENPYLKKYYNAMRAKYPNIKSGELITARGENMEAIPSNSIDAVVVTLVLCSVDNVQRVIDEIYRVLVPNGRFFFMEHVKEWDERNKSRINRQIWYDRLWFLFMFRGGKLTRNPISAIQSAGFSDVNYEKFYAKKKGVRSPHVMGVAVK